MSTLEKLFMHVFDRKQWIGEQLRQQIDSYEESLACNVAARGRELPSWLFVDGPQSRSDALMPDTILTELNRKQNITDLLFPPSRVTTPANRNTCFPISSYRRTQSFQDIHLTGACSSVNHIQNPQINEEIPNTSLGECNEEQSQIQPEMTDIGAFSTIQRSRLRQKDIEKRSSVKKVPVDSTASFRQTDNTKADFLDIELIETSDQCRRGYGKEMQQKETASVACHIMSTELTEPLGCAETGIVGPEHLSFDVALTVSKDYLNSVTEKHEETMNQRSHFHVEKGLSSPVGKSCGTRQGEKEKEAEMLESSTSHLMNPVLIEALSSVKTSAFEIKRLGFSLASAGFVNNLDSLVDNQDETGDGKPGSVLESKPWHSNGESSGMMHGEEMIEGVEKLVKVMSPQITAQELTSTSKSMLNDIKFGEPRDSNALIAEGFLSPKRLGQSGPRETEAALHGHDSFLPDGVSGDEERNEAISDFVKGTSPGSVNTEPTESLDCMDNDNAQDTSFPTLEGLQPMIKQSVDEGSDVREVEKTFYARDSYSPIGDVTGGNNGVTEVDEPTVGQVDISALRCELDQSLRKTESELENLLLSQSMQVAGEEVLDVSDRRCPLASSFHEVSRPSSSLSGATFSSCRSHLTTPDIVVAHLEEDTKSVDTNLKSVSTDPKTQGEESLVKSGEGIKHLSSGGRYLLHSSARPEKSNVSVLQDGIVALDSLECSGVVHFQVNVNSGPKRRKMEVFSDSAFATSPRPRKRLVLPKASYCRIEEDMEEDVSEASVLVLEEFNRVPSMSSSSADNGKAPVSPMASNIGSPTFDANHFSISPKDGDMANTFTYMPEVDVYSPHKDDLANSSKYAHEIDAGTSVRCHGGSFVDQEDTGPEMEAFTMGISSDSEGESGNIPETNPLRMERASLIEQLSFSLRNLTAPGSCFSTKYKLNTLSDMYKSLPAGQLDFMKTCEALSVPVKDRKKLSASVSAIPCQSGPFGYTGFKMGLSTSGQSAWGKPTTTTPAEKVGYRRGIPPLTPPAQKYSSRMLSEIDESGNGSETRSGTRSFGKTPLYPELTCFRIDEDAAEDDVPNENDALEPQDLLAVLEESALPSVNESHNPLEDDGPIYESTLQDTTDVLENTAAGVAITENCSEVGGCTGKKPKQGAVLNKRELSRKASGSMRNGLATLESIQKGQEKNMGTVSSKPSNIVSGVTSFVPLVKQKQQPTAKKREVRIPALEAAEANKKLEEKKRNERELRKAAQMAEREKLNQEKVLKKKQEEQKKEADMVAKKRQREEREKKEKEKDKERKRKCTEIDRQTQREEPTKKEPPKRARVAREEKELQHSVVDEQEQSKREECGTEDAPVRPRGTGSSINIVDDAVKIPELSRVVEKSYEMSPYKDSDAEGDDDLDEVEEDKIRRKKFIPSWAQKEFLEDYLQSKKYLNPDIIFSCKCSFDLTKVLKSHNQKQRF